METELFDYELPLAAIAQHPPPEREGGRLLVVTGNEFISEYVRNWPELLAPGSLVVLNDTRVRPSRVFGQRESTGGRVEFLLLERLELLPDGSELYAALGRANTRLRSGAVVWVDSFRFEVRERLPDGTFRVAVSGQSPLEEALPRIGHMPIPPYLGRPDQESDRERYQTVYAEHAGSVAAPTAGLHLTERALARLGERGITVGRVTLHVGLGTFRPVTVPDLDQHAMHEERYHVTPELAEMIARARAEQRPVVAVGTTVVRALESAACPERLGEVRAGSAETRLLIQPGYRFRVVDQLLTNFHMPKSTLLALVAAFCGLPRMRAAYATALERGFRFLSYGDAMWLPERV